MDSRGLTVLPGQDAGLRPRPSSCRQAGQTASHRGAEGTTAGGLPEYTLDRVDSSGGYEPGNVRWATRLEQHP